MRLRLTSHGKERRLKSLGRRVVRHVSVRRLPCDVSRRSMSRCSINAAFAASLEKKYSRRTVLKHTSIVELFSIFLCDYTDVERLENVTRGMVNTPFRRWYRRKVLDRMDTDETRVALKKFFQFLDQEQGIHNPKALDALR